MRQGKLPSEVAGLPIPAAAGVDWVQRSLAGGSPLAQVLSGRVSVFTDARLLVPASKSRDDYVYLDNASRGVSQASVDEIAVRALGQLHRAGVRTLVVEDDLALKGDPLVGADVAYCDKRVLRWVDLDAGIDSAVLLLRTGASGYPLIAFACQGQYLDLGFRRGASLDSSGCTRLAESACSIIVSVYDAEAYVLLLDADLGARIGNR